MKRVALFALLLATLVLSAAAQSANTIRPVIFRIAGAALSQINPSLGPGHDSIQVIVRTENPETVTVRVTLTYLDAGSTVTAVSERPIRNGFDIHSFTVPSCQVAITSINIKELAVVADQTHTGY